MNLIQSVYIHIPFCQQICHYCDFTKFFYNEKLATEYIVALKKEMDTYVEGNKNKVKTIFIGGGTPTALNLEQLETLLQAVDAKFDVNSCEEYTIEANPGDFDEDKINLLKMYGVNRISLGVQVFDDKKLKELGRLHTVQDVYRTVNLLKRNSFTNISVDLIYALPNQTVADFRRTLEEAVALNLPHLSTYALQIEPKTVFYQRHQKGKLHRPAQEEEVEMYELLKQTAKANGLIQYEISNFAKEGFESKHNLTYWNNKYYYGFGAGASGYLPGKRTINIRPLPKYIKQSMQNGQPILHVDEIGLKEQIEEELFLGLRKTSGVSKVAFKQKFGMDLEKLYEQSINELTKKNWLVNAERKLYLTEEGMLLANEVFERFLLDEEPSKNKN
ncbi:radical SAM family heme chaperone HemW [Virgibacillus halodenitrificans]|uniref:radical SAM family heme chaperone HemW n=1 Tax=Virgibacillus halodenitrificans TaxID=1482 RepID=UPI002DB5FCAD|nr:radical SAM family heme chaperone HemW [Virgibacillus halodenitrificans]MEC2160043.1 radical SAM family heme chaperone HemW [Virgibacillus halodenitrificans]